MPSFQNIVLQDAATPTPRNRTFTPQSNRGGLAIVSESGVTKIGEPRLELSTDFKRGLGRKFIAKTLLVVPVVQERNDGGVTSPVIVRTGVIETKYSFDQASTEQERKDIIAMHQSSFAPSKPLVYQTLTKLEDVWGGE